VNLPNKLSFTRLFLLVPFLVFTYTDNVWTRLFAFIIFIGAGVTDLYDGYLARKVPRGVIMLYFRAR
jgi:CDP-diacylglycerol---glycerol-3-phosphate 3-phosphatidyltransferase